MKNVPKIKKPKRVKKPWGYEDWIINAQKYVGKLLVINKGHRLSKQYHRVKQETIYTLKGRLKLELNGKTRILSTGKSIKIPPKCVHRFAAPYGQVILIEVSTPQLSDIVRLEDDYGR